MEENNILILPITVALKSKTNWLIRGSSSFWFFRSWDLPLFLSFCVQILAEPDLIWWCILTIIGRNYKIVGFGYKNVVQEDNEKTDNFDALGLPCHLTWSNVSRIVKDAWVIWDKSGLQQQGNVIWILDHVPELAQELQTRYILSGPAAACVPAVPARWCGDVLAPRDITGRPWTPLGSVSVWRTMETVAVSRRNGGTAAVIYRPCREMLFLLGEQPGLHPHCVWSPC